MEPLDLTDRAKAAQAKARVLREALPWITRWAGRTVVVKYGGNASVGMQAATFAADVALLHSVGLRVVVVHGGGPQISALSERLGLEPTFVEGQRVTDAATLEVVRMVLLGQVNPQLVGMICSAGAPAVGVAGTDAGLIRARQGDPALGAVGEVEAVDPHVLVTLLDSGAVPVVATVGRDPEGRELNINADTVAGAVAVSLRADKLIYLTNVPGLYEDFGTASSTLLSEVGVGRLRAMLTSGELHTGMIPKVASIVAAFDGGIEQAHLLDGRIEHALLLEIFTDEGIGTMVTPRREQGVRVGVDAPAGKDEELRSGRGRA
ncbi:MAG: acetylglutamate kinase [Egibacteraceae bacterium]